MSKPSIYGRWKRESNGPQPGVANTLTFLDISFQSIACGRFSLYAIIQSSLFLQNNNCLLLVHNQHCFRPSGQSRSSNAWFGDCRSLDWIVYRCYVLVPACFIFLSRLHCRYFNSWIVVDTDKGLYAFFSLFALFY